MELFIIIAMGIIISSLFRITREVSSIKDDLMILRDKYEKKGNKDG